jgi:hypothetical protein
MTPINAGKRNRKAIVGSRSLIFIVAPVRTSLVPLGHALPRGLGFEALVVRLATSKPSVLPMLLAMRLY